MRAANHHGRGTAKHISHKGFTAPHIDPARTKDNIYWTWDSKSASHTAPDTRASEIRYYTQVFQAGLDAQNDKHKARRQYARIRSIEDVYRERNTQPEESLLYIGNRSYLGDVSPSVLWQCISEYINWERDYSKSHGGFYQPLSLALHANENGQIHIHERGVYKHKDESGNWRIGQAKALEAAGFALPDPSKPRSKNNNRKMTWDAARREKWLDIVESHGYVLEREPEAPRPHLPLEAWKELQDALRDVEAQADMIRQKAAEIDIERQQTTAEADKIRKMKQAADREREALDSRRQALEDWERELDERESALETRETAVKRREALLTELGRERYQKALQEHQTARETERIRMAEEITMISTTGKKRTGKRSSTDRQI